MLSSCCICASRLVLSYAHLVSSRLVPVQVRELGKREVFDEVHRLGSFAEGPEDAPPKLQRLSLARAISEIADSGQLDVDAAMVKSLSRSSSFTFGSNKVTPLNSTGSSIGSDDSSRPFRDTFRKPRLAPIEGSIDGALHLSSFSTEGMGVLEEAKEEEVAKEPAVTLTVKAEAGDLAMTDVALEE